MTLALADALVSGIPIDAGQTTRCDRCGQTLRPNDSVEVLVLLEAGDVEIVAKRCESCDRGKIRDETCRSCWLARGTVVGAVSPTGRSRVIIGGAEVVDRNE